MAFNNEMLSYFANKMWSKNKDTFVSKETGKGLSTNDYTNEDKNKLDNLSAETTSYSNTASGLTSTNVQGAIDEINTELSTKSDTSHNHDDSYYTKTEINSKLSDLPTGAETTSCDMSIFGKKVKKIDYECDASDTFHNSLKIETSVLPYKFSSGNAVVYNNEIHILGGGDSSTLTKHYKYDGASWTEVSTLPYDFSYGGVVVYNNEIHILGGSVTPGSTGIVYNGTKHYKYDGTNWTEVSTLPYEFSFGSAVVYNNEIHILGGNMSYDSDFNITYNGTKHYKYDGTSWTEVSTLPYDFCRGSAVIYNNEIHILGGNDSNTLTKHYKYDGTSWTEVSTLPYKFYSGSAVVYNNEIHILGGSNNNYGMEDVSHGIYTGNKWLYIENILPYEFRDGGAVIYNNEIHILGGSVSGNSTKHYKYDGVSWTEVSTLPYEFSDGGAVIYNNEIHILGGNDTNTRTKHYKYDGTSWTEVSTLPYKFYRGDAVVYNNEIHILGGNGGDTSTKHYKYDGASWTEVSTLPYKFYGSSAVVYNNEIHILGGNYEGNETKHYKYNGVSWTEVSTLPYKFRTGNAVVYNNEIHILGGGDSSTLTKHYKYDGASWTEVSTLPYEFSSGNAVVLQGIAFILGGYYDTEKMAESDLDYNTLRVKSVYYQ